MNLAPEVRDFGYIGMGAAAFYYLSKSLYTTLRQQNGNRPKGIGDLYDLFKDHHEQEMEHQEKLVACFQDLKIEMTRILERMK